MQKFGLHFNGIEEFAKRIQIFADNFDKIQAHNAGNHTYTLGLNQFSHLTNEEFKAQMNLGGLKVPQLRRGQGKLHGPPMDVSALPASVDWVSAGAVTPVKNQGSCGSCWSFSTTGAIEGAYYLKTKVLKSFSEQELVSCDPTNYGCNGGWMDTAFTWIMGNRGLAYEDDYPYVSGEDGVVPACDMTGISVDSKATPSAYTDVIEKSVSALMSAVAQQPVSIAIEADQTSFQSYSSGVLTAPCGQNLDHGVLLVGYGTWTDGTPYWKVKNSWGSSWGMDGYILIERSDADLCGVLDAPSYPSL
jgi:C1A family cysteine protease